MRFRYSLFLLFLLSGPLLAIDLENDTIRLQEVTIRGSYYEKFSPGSVVKRSDSVDMVMFQAYNLNDIIGYKNSIFFKSYGSGMLSTISFRGTGAGHTSVIWNGVNINQPTIGQTDFSLYPVFAFDDIRVFYGASSSIFGSEAIGGGISLDSKPDWNRQFSGGIGQYIGSYGNFLTHLKAQVKIGEKVLSSTKLYWHSHKNDFKFENFTKPGSPVERQQNARIFQYGLMQDVYVTTSKNSQLVVNGWFNYSDRQIQPTMGNEDADDTQKDESLRIIANYAIQSSFGFFEITGGFLRDLMIYNDFSTILTEQYLGQFSYENYIGDWEFRLGSKWNHIDADVDSYNGSRTENRSDIFGGIVNNSLDGAEFSLNVRQTFVTGYKTPLAPSIGLRYDLLHKGRYLLTLTGQGSLNYRVPTLNDRYWVPGGRENILPEKSRNLDAALIYQYTGNINAEVNLGTYYYWIDDWIMWVPGPSYWVPENVRKVDSYGFELSGSIGFRIGSMATEISGNYAMPRSIIKASVNENDIGIGHQLPYTPVHMAGMNVTGTINTWYVNISGNYTGKRYVTSDNESELPAYALLNVRTGKNLNFGKQQMSVDFRINNVFNTSYEVVKFRAMPGINYMIGINFLFNK